MTLRARFSALRTQYVFPTVRLALSGAARRDPDAFRLVHFSVQGNHVHLIVEARDKRALSRGIRSIAIRVARYVNDLLMRRGALWADRWHGRALKTPREVRRAMVYVLANFRKHLQSARAGVDPYASGEWLDGWRDWTPRSGIAPPWAEMAPWRVGHDASSCVVMPPRTWLASKGWRRHGLLEFDAQPAS